MSKEFFKRPGDYDYEHPHTETLQLLAAYTIGACAPSVCFELVETAAAGTPTPIVILAQHIPAATSDSSTTNSGQSPASESSDGADQPSDTQHSADANHSRPADKTQQGAPASSRPSGVDSEAAEDDASSDRNDSQSISSAITDGSDDDTVARQLREAAEAETDPVPRERLWEEYREYKKASQ